MCPDDSKLLNLLGRELDPAERPRFEEHLSGCTFCRDRYEEFRSVWAQLGRWEAPPPQTDLRSRVLMAARRESSSRRWIGRGAVAAAVALAAGMGWTIGRLPQPATAQAGISTQQMVEIVGLDRLGGDINAFAPIVPSDEMLDPGAQGGQS